MKTDFKIQKKRGEISDFCAEQMFGGGLTNVYLKKE